MSRNFSERKARRPSTFPRATADKVECGGDAEWRETPFECNIPLRMLVLQRVRTRQPNVRSRLTDPFLHVLGRFKMENRCMRAEPSTVQGSLPRSACHLQTRSEKHSYHRACCLQRWVTTRQRLRPQILTSFADHIAQSADMRTTFVGPQPPDGNGRDQAAQEREFARPHILIQDVRCVRVRHQRDQFVPRC